MDERIGWGFLFHFSFFSFPKHRCVPLCLSQLNPQLSRAESSSSVAPFVCTHAPELPSARVCPCWRYPYRVSSVRAMPTSSFPSVFTAQCTCGPLMPEAAFCMDKAGWSTCLHCWMEMKGVVSKRQKRRKKSSVLSISDCFVVVMVVVADLWLSVFKLF